MAAALFELVGDIGAGEEAASLASRLLPSETSLIENQAAQRLLAPELSSVRSVVTNPLRNQISKLNSIRLRANQAYENLKLKGNPTQYESVYKSTTIPEGQKYEFRPQSATESEGELRRNPYNQYNQFPSMSTDEFNNVLRSVRNDAVPEKQSLLRNNIEARNFNRYVTPSESGSEYELFNRATMPSVQRPLLNAETSFAREVEPVRNTRSIKASNIRSTTKPSLFSRVRQGVSNIVNKAGTRNRNIVSRNTSSGSSARNSIRQKSISSNTVPKVVDEGPSSSVSRITNREMGARAKVRNQVRRPANQRPNRPRSNRTVSNRTEPPLRDAKYYYDFEYDYPNNRFTDSDITRRGSSSSGMSSIRPRSSISSTSSSRSSSSNISRGNRRTNRINKNTRNLNITNRSNALNNALLGTLLATNVTRER